MAQIKNVLWAGLQRLQAQLPNCKISNYPAVGSRQ